MPFIERNHVKIHYEEQGSGEALLLLMGLGADLSVWEPHRKVYEKYFRCISIDNRGAGLSDLGRSEDCTTRAMADDAAAVLDALHITRAQVAGISMGGAIAQMLASARPELVTGLLLIDTFARPTAYMKRVMETLQTCYDVLSPLEFDRLLQEFIYSPRTFADNGQMIAEREAEIGNQEDRMPSEAFRAQCSACILHDSTEDLGRIKAPAMIVTGKDDLLTPITSAGELQQGIKGAKVYINRGGHVQHFEYTEDFNRVSLAFLMENI